MTKDNRLKCSDDANLNNVVDVGESVIESNSFHVQPVTVHEVKVRYSSTIFANFKITQESIRDYINQATNLAIRKDDAEDYRSAMQFKVTSYVVFVPTGMDGSRPATADTRERRDRYHNNPSGFTFTFLSDLGGEPPGSSTELAGETAVQSTPPVFANHVLVNFVASTQPKPGVILHEFGHTKGLRHLNQKFIDATQATPNPNGDVPDSELPHYIMAPVVVGQGKRLRAMEANTLD